MKKILVLDLWHGADSGAGKSALYSELANFYELEFMSVKMPGTVKLLKYLKSFHPKIDKWKTKKAKLEECIQKYPFMFRLTTGLFNEALEKASGGHSAILQIGSLFGPVGNPKGLPYLSYHDSTVADVDGIWDRWLPEDFSEFRGEWFELERSMFSSMTRIMTYSRFVKDTLESRYSIAPEKITIVGSALKMPADYEIKWDEKLPSVIFVTTDFERKGGFSAIRIFERVVKEVPYATMTIAGKVPPEINSVKKPWLYCAGPVGKEKLMELYMTSSVMLHPAIYDPFPSVILEAANFGVPAVAAPVCGIPEIIEDGKTGFLEAQEDEAAKRIITLLKNRSLLKEMGGNAKKSVRDRFHPAKVAGNIHGVIAGCL